MWFVLILSNFKILSLLCMTDNWIIILYHVEDLLWVYLFRIWCFFFQDWGNLLPLFLWVDFNTSNFIFPCLDMSKCGCFSFLNNFLIVKILYSFFLLFLFFFYIFHLLWYWKNYLQGPVLFLLLDFSVVDAFSLTLT